MARRSLALLALLAAGCAEPAAAPVAPSASALPSLIASVPTPAPTAKPALAVPAGAFLFFEDFERGVDRWELPEGAEKPQWRQLQAYTCGGAYTMLLGRPKASPYVPAEGASILALKAPIDLKKAVKPVLKFDVVASATPADALTVQPEVKAGEGDWQPLGEAVTASYPLMLPIVRELTPYVGQAIALRFRATMRAGSGETRGFYLDDVHVIEPG